MKAGHCLVCEDCPLSYLPFHLVYKVTFTCAHTIGVKGHTCAYTMLLFEVPCLCKIVHVSAHWTAIIVEKLLVIFLVHACMYQYV